MNDSYKAKFATKWSEDVANRGFVPVPKCLITCMGDLDLKPQEAAILFNIIERCWKAGEVSWQKVDTMATNIGRKNSATRVITSSLAKKGFITKTQQYNTSSIYDLEPLIEKLDKHMKDCRHTVRKPEGYSQKSGSRDSQKSSDYIEPIPRNLEVEPNYSQHFINEDTDRIDLNDFNKDVAHKHEWREYEVEKCKGEEPFTRYYFTCKDCGKQYHKDGEKPWLAEYPLLNS